MNNRIELIARKGADVVHAWVIAQVVTQVSRGWADRGYAVTVIIHPNVPEGNG